MLHRITHGFFIRMHAGWEAEGRGGAIVGAVRAIVKKALPPKARGKRHAHEVLVRTRPDPSLHRVRRERQNDRINGSGFFIGCRRSFCWSWHRCLSGRRQVHLPGNRGTAGLDPTATTATSSVASALITSLEPSVTVVPDVGNVISTVGGIPLLSSRARYCAMCSRVSPAVPNSSEVVEAVFAVLNAVGVGVGIVQDRSQVELVDVRRPSLSRSSRASEGSLGLRPRLISTSSGMPSPSGSAPESIT